MTAPLPAPRPARARPRPGPRPAPAPPPSRRLRVVPDPPAKRGRHGRRVLPAAAALALAAALFGLVAAHAALAGNQFRLQDLERRSAAQQDAYERLRLEVAELEAPQRILAAAREQLGMVEPGAVTLLAPPASRRPAAPAAPSGGAEPAGATAAWAGVKRTLGSP